MTDIFISYRREDGVEYAEELVRLLKNKGCRVFFDKDNLKIGDEYPLELEKSLNSCQDIVLIISKSYFGKNKVGKARIFVEDDWVRREIKVAIDLKKKILPIVIDEGIDPYSLNLPDEINHIKNLQFENIDKNQLNNNIEKLIEKFSDKTRKHIKYDNFIEVFDDIGNENNKDFSKKIKKIVTDKNFNKNTISVFLIPLLESREDENLKFICYYAIFTYYRRMEFNIELINFVDVYKDNFIHFKFNNIVLTQYYRIKYEKELKDLKFLDDAIYYSKEAIKSIDNNFGVYLTFSELVMIGLDNNYYRYKRYLNDAIKYIQMADKLYKNYPKILYVQGKLYAYNGSIKEGLATINRAISLEDMEIKDSFLRVLSYNTGKLEIKQTLRLKKMQNIFFLTQLLLILIIILLLYFN
ncbi:TIR domain-containing protein [Macrococcoides canis]|uniref:toll/interleukin-1 receptor domain-containing protein n=1 Tax=Macrococcoides canis TaxID=1855823 RepID=UPI0013E90387|nr:toll/interleukin-1 receptor domain-containing protein [Macrococcus canis]QIH75184.1 TIR domain-containing protein [Macrococcus canis]